jgi:hypothetical protein
MADFPLSENFDWVRARAECSIAHVYKQLYNDVIRDVEVVKSLLPTDMQVKFTVTNGKGSFSVVREICGLIPDSVNFSIYRNESITAQDDDNTFQFTATLTLNNEGKCRLKVGDLELCLWQFRRMALEKLFFVLRRT